ncbi:homocysteine S-methyltransferase family protein [Aliiroseovarius subalbicans]|uniref:homocysteine S-methyltransferase family protein n=1 Tax=Aliiroseovarius subalbicans TaxID=2925840 RepID=UPI001F57528F|nr:homocysteine S-methyltransferase family protein [Aliiroseovarius subalbicans]MCI2400207.1 homocysteine S-methyltransferase family protein [Aliiroseovarius subalbicans]
MNITLKDGGTGQELIHRSTRPAHPLWSAKVMMEEPDLVQQVHEDYIRAGARLITLNTYSTTPERLEREGAGDMCDALYDQARMLVERARDATGIEVKIGACLPPLHGSYNPDMSRSHDDLLPAYREIAEKQAGCADVMLCETMSSISELTASARAAQETGVPTYASMSLMDDGSARLRSGESLADALEALGAVAPDAIGLNCSKPEVVSRHLPQLADTGLPVGAYANGFTGIDALTIGGTVDGLSARTDVTPARYTEFCQGWIDMGATLLGGCCEVGPAHIKHLANHLKQNGHTIIGTLA